MLLLLHLTGESFSARPILCKRWRPPWFLGFLRGRNPERDCSFAYASAIARLTCVRMRRPDAKDGSAAIADTRRALFAKEICKTADVQHSPLTDRLATES